MNVMLKRVVTVQDVIVEGSEKPTPFRLCLSQDDWQVTGVGPAQIRHTWPAVRRELTL